MTTSNNFQSKYDPTRETLGKIYTDMVQNGPKDKVEVGDMRNELMSSLVEDLNEELKDLAKDKDFEKFDGKPYYLRIYEKRDYIMQDVFRRNLYRTLYRPYPEPDSLVFWRSADRNTIKLCWMLPERFVMRNMLESPDLFWDRAEEMRMIQAWENFELQHFGFIKDEMGNWLENDRWKGDIEIKSSPNAVNLIIPAK